MIFDFCSFNDNSGIIKIMIFLPYPSEIFDGMETADFLICEAKAYISSFWKTFRYFIYLQTKLKRFLPNV